MKREWFWQIQYHALIMVSLVLVIIALVKLESNHVTDASTLEDLLKAGVGIVLLSWILLVFWVIQSCVSMQDNHAMAYRNGTKVRSCVYWRS
jgi:uncharacterized Tic20 family protein